MRAGIAIARMVTQMIKSMEGSDSDFFLRKRAVVKALLGVIEVSVDEMHLDEVDACLEAINGQTGQPFFRDRSQQATFRVQVQELVTTLQNHKTALEAAHSRITGY